MKRNILILLAIILYVFSNISLLHAMTADEMAKLIPDKVLDFKASEPPTIQNLDKPEGKYYRVQKLYKSKNELAAVAAICGAEVNSNVKSVFDNAKAINIKGFSAVVNISAKYQNNSVTVYVKLKDNAMITVMLMNTTDDKLAIKFLNKLDLKGLSDLATTAARGE